MKGPAFRAAGRGFFRNSVDVFPQPYKEVDVNIISFTLLQWANYEALVGAWGECAARLKEVRGIVGSFDPTSLFREQKLQELDAAEAKLTMCPR
jgi:hypothetical protein